MTVLGAPPIQETEDYVVYGSPYVLVLLVAQPVGKTEAKIVIVIYVWISMGIWSIGRQYEYELPIEKGL